MSKERSISIQSEEEIDAILLGLCLVMQVEESECYDAAEALLERIVAALPEPGRRSARKRWLAASLASSVDAAIHHELQLCIAYQDRKGSGTKRTIWPVELYAAGPDDGIVLAWCETRSDFRNFRIDRMQSLDTLDRYPVRRQLLQARWRIQQGDKGFY